MLSMCETVSIFKYAKSMPVNDTKHVRFGGDGDVGGLDRRDFLAYVEYMGLLDRIAKVSRDDLLV